MDRNLELAAMASVGGLSAARAGHVSRIGQPCANCATVLQGPYCHACGQLAEEFERSILSLLVEAFENLFHADGRLVRTLPALVFHPARLTRDYLAGKRAYQMPPLRLFLVVVVAFFLAGNLKDAISPSRTHWMAVNLTSRRARPAIVEMSPSDLSEMDASGPLGRWAKPRVVYALSHPRELAMNVESWLHRVAIAFLPISALILGLLFVFPRRFFLYDHAIFSMQSLSFLGLLLTVATLVGIWPPLRGVGALLMLAAPVHLFVHMRGTYRISVLGTLARMAMLGVLSAIAFAVLMTGVVVLGVSNLGQG